jgi:hypothetical protein
MLEKVQKLEKSSLNLLIFSVILIEKEPLVNTFISLPKDKSSLNCAAFTAGIIESFLTVIVFLHAMINFCTFQGSNFPCKVSVHWHLGTAYVIEFDQEIIDRENNADSNR